MRINKSCAIKHVNKPAGMGLIEIIVAIGISVITLTTAVSLSVRISIRAQENFVETSVLQYQALVSEELRLLETGLKKDVIAGATFATGSFLPAAAPPYLTWSKFCGSAPNDEYMGISLPNYNVPNSTDILRLTSATAGTIEYIPELVEGSENGRFRFTPLVDSNNNSIAYKFGSFDSSNMPMQLSLKKSVTASTVFNGNANFNNITITSVLRYRLYNKYYYTKPQQIRMVYSSVCPKS